MAKWYQLIFSYGGSCKSLAYFESKGKPEEEAAAKANEYLEKELSRPRIMGSAAISKVVTVKEYDKATHKTVRGGHTFKLRLTSMKIKTNLRTISEQWYEAI